MQIIRGRAGSFSYEIRDVDRAPVKPVRKGQVTLETLDKAVTGLLTPRRIDVSVDTPGGHEARDAD